MVEKKYKQKDSNRIFRQIRNLEVFGPTLLIYMGNDQDFEKNSIMMRTMKKVLQYHL